MALFTNMKVSTRLALGFGAIVLIGTAISIFGALKMRTLAGNLDEVANNRMVKTFQFAAYKDNLNIVASSVRNMVITQDNNLRNGEKKKIEESRAANAKLLAQLEQSTHSPQATEFLKIIKETGPRYYIGIDKVSELASRGADASAGSELMGDVQNLQNTLFKAVGDSMALQQTLAAKLANEAAAEAAASMTVLISLALLMLLIGTGVGWAITRNLSRSLGGEPAELCDAVSRVADGDLSARLQLHTGDTASVLAAVERMQTSLTRVVGTVRQGSESVASASAEIAQGNQDLSARTEQQASALEETAASMEELSATVKQNADNAKQANQLAQSASTVAIQGGHMVSQVVDTMKGINDASRKISDIISVIDGIAFQTNILALNAAVEAARAGEQGRGFAVVASEVRSLAGRSANAAKEIKSLINTSVERVEQGTAQVDQAGATMTEVVGSIRRVTDLMGEITAASVEQSQGVAQVGEAVTQMDQTTQQNAALVEEMAAAASSLKTQAQDLVGTVAVFKLSQDDVGGRAHNTTPQRTINARPAPVDRTLESGAKTKIVPSPAPRSLAAPVTTAHKTPRATTANAGGDDWESF
ncbi:methyl-accepting chemotaxis protein [Rhodoferax ferrireducens]|uniref:methyl-accepting chemotaxis protein n=1 Tax=Rhodoferax ferrireducens TaxID=192843 RepID=UPI00298D8BD8|nr:methyl-accepting chemotaxis protein [Rhodoferax ferrireducens]WPC66702.1 methyl-accepting chemotaxis protein [Rhodoferax ferrireducens]